MVAINYPDPADKTNANYEELVRLISTDLGDRPYPGNKIRHYLMNKVKYMSYRRPDGRRYKPTDVLRRLSQCRELGSRLEHLMPGGNILTDAKFLLLIWNIFPRKFRNG